MGTLLNISSYILLIFLNFNQLIPIISSTDSDLLRCVSYEHCAQSEFQTNNVQHSFDMILEKLKTTPRTKILEVNGNYIKASAKSKWLRFVDKIEVLAIKEKGLIEIKSESQLGFKDMGVNKKRIEIIKSYLKNS